MSDQTQLSSALEQYIDRRRLERQAEIARHLAEHLAERAATQAVLDIAEADENSRRFLDAILRQR